MKILFGFFALIAFASITNGQQLSEGIDRLKDGITQIGEITKTLGGNFIDTAVTVNRFAAESVGEVVRGIETQIPGMRPPVPSPARTSSKN